MALTRDFKTSVLARVERDPEFARALLSEAVGLFLDNDPQTAKLILRDLINATVGFDRIAADIQKPAKSIHRMLSSSGNPTIENLSLILHSIKKALNVRIKAAVIPI